MKIKLVYKDSVKINEEVYSRFNQPERYKYTGTVYAPAKCHPYYVALIPVVSDLGDFIYKDENGRRFVRTSDIDVYNLKYQAIEAGKQLAGVSSNAVNPLIKLAADVLFGADEEPKCKIKYPEDTYISHTITYNKDKASVIYSYGRYFVNDVEVDYDTFINAHAIMAEPGDDMNKIASIKDVLNEYQELQSQKDEKKEKDIDALRSIISEKLSEINTLQEKLIELTK